MSVLKFNQVSGADGVTHINVYSKGVTSLGRALSNFARTPFTLDGVSFASVEAYWYWVKTGGASPRNTYGYWAKAEGKKFEPTHEDPTKEQLKEAYKAKLTAHPHILEQLLENKLPLAHYYVFGGGPKSADKYLWTIELWEELKKEHMD